MSSGHTEDANGNGKLSEPKNSTLGLSTLPETNGKRQETKKCCGWRQDVIAWMTSMLFIAVLLIGVWAWGHSIGWYAPSGVKHKVVNSSTDRFLPEPTYCNETSKPGRYGIDCTYRWYYWKLPVDDVTPLTRAIVWLFYCCHQLLIWGLIYRAQLVTSMKARGEKYSTDLRWFNWSMLAVNGLFHILHLVQTHWTYDGLAQDLSMISSQCSVIMMIAFIMLMEYRDRGLAFMWPNPRSKDRVAKYLRLNMAPVNLVRKYHGVAFSWAVIYTFWYHPMENTVGHILGFMHTAMVMLQGSLAFTDIHLNRYWRLLNECWVLVHATVVAVQTGDHEVAGGSVLWPIFTLGFGLIFALTQIFSIPLWKRVSPYFRPTTLVIYLAIAVALAGTVIKGRNPGQTGFGRLYEMCFVPAQLYLTVLAAWLCIYLLLKLDACFPNQGTSPTQQAFSLCGIVFLYSLFVLTSYLVRHLVINGTILSVILTTLFSIGVGVTTLLFKRALGPFRKVTPATGKVNDDGATPGGENAE